MAKTKRLKLKTKHLLGFTSETCKSCGDTWYRYRGPSDDNKYKDCWNCAAGEIIEGNKKLLKKLDN